MQRIVSQKQIIMILLAVIVVGFAVGYLQYAKTMRRDRLEEVARYASIMSTPKRLPSFHLLDEMGQPFSEQQLQGHWSFLFFGFTHCQKVCPQLLATLRQTSEVLHDVDDLPAFNIVMVSVDPKRDDSATLKRYVQSFGRNVHGLTGDPDQIKALAAQLHIAYGKDAMTHRMSHSSAVMLLDDQAKLRAVFTAPHSVEHLANGFVTLATSNV